jgi:hypothetical protein
MPQDLYQMFQAGAKKWRGGDCTAPRHNAIYGGDKYFPDHDERIFPVGGYAESPGLHGLMGGRWVWDHGPSLGAFPKDIDFRAMAEKEKIKFAIVLGQAKEAKEKEERRQQLKEKRERIKQKKKVYKKGNWELFDKSCYPTWAKFKIVDGSMVAANVKWIDGQWVMTTEETA